MAWMASLALWLKQIVSVVLLASLVDLLLPNRTMQRYVRLVAGMFILLAVAGPLLHGMRGDLGSRLAAGLQRIDLAPPDASAQLSRIQSDGRELSRLQRREAADLAAARLEAAIRSDIERSEGRKVRRVDVQWEPETKVGGGPEVRRVIVVLEAVSEDAAGKSSPGTLTGPVAAVKPVAPVAALESLEALASRDAAGDQDADRTDPDLAERQRITALIASRYGIDADRVEVSQTAQDGT